MSKQRRTELSLVVGDERSLPDLSGVREVLADLPEATQNEVIEETRKIFTARRQFGLSYLAMGEHFIRVREILGEEGKWKAYISCLPNLGYATVYRMIWASENAAKALPPATRAIAMRDGYKLISSKKGGAFAPGYDRAVRAVTKKLGPPPEQDEVAAGSWLQAVAEKKKELRGRNGLRVQTSRMSIEESEVEILMRVRKLIRDMDGRTKPAFGRRLAGMILTICEVTANKVRPMPVPSKLLEQVA